MVEHLQQGVVVALDIQNAAGFTLHSQLSPGEDLAEFFEGTVATGQAINASARSAINALRSCMEFTIRRSGNSRVRHFFGDQRTRNHADDFAASCASRVGQDAHESDISAAVNDRESADHQASRDRTAAAA